MAMTNEASDMTSYQYLSACVGRILERTFVLYYQTGRKGEATIPSVEINLDRSFRSSAQANDTRKSRDPAMTGPPMESLSSSLACRRSTIKGDRSASGRACR